MLGEIQVKFVSENYCKITQFSANIKINKPFIYRVLQKYGIACNTYKYDS